MSSIAERQAATVWTLADALAEGCEKPGTTDELKRAVHCLAAYIRHDWETDKAMIRLGRNLKSFVKARTCPEKFDHKPHVGRKDLLAYVHMLAALTGDHLGQLPERPPARRLAWVNLNNATAGLLDNLAGEGSEVSAARGCGWAEEVKTIMNAI